MNAWALAQEKCKSMSPDPIVSANIRCRLPEAFRVGEGSIIDDFCYFSTQVEIGRFCHVANGVSVAGGKDRKFTLGDFSAVSAGVKIWCSSDDFTRDLGALPPPGVSISKHTIHGDVAVSELCIVGSNSVIMPDNRLPVGVAIGALSLVPPRFTFDEWSLYAGVPLRLIRRRDKDGILRQREQLERQVQMTQPIDRPTGGKNP